MASMQQSTRQSHQKKRLKIYKFTEIPISCYVSFQKNNKVLCSPYQHHEVCDKCNCNNLCIFILFVFYSSISSRKHSRRIKSFYGEPCESFENAVVAKYSEARLHKTKISNLGLIGNCFKLSSTAVRITPTPDASKTFLWTRSNCFNWIRRNIVWD